MPTARRTLVIVLTLLAVLVPAAPSPARAQADDTITIGMTDFPRSLDPGETTDLVAWEILSHLYTGLTRQTPGTLEYELALASDIQASDDRLTYTVMLREGAAFSDGTPITAQIFVDSINRVVALNRDAANAVTPYVQNVEAAESGELIFRLRAPVPYFLGLLALPPYFPVHPSLLDSPLPQPFAENLVGNGPYTLESFAVNQQIVLKANPAYDLGPPPETATIVLQRFERSQDMREALRDHQIDLAWRALFLGDLAALDGVDDLRVIDIPSTRAFYVYMNHGLEPFDDPLVREAITVLLHRQPVVDDIFNSRATALTSLVPALFPDAYAPIWPDAPDVTYAETVLRAAAYSGRGQFRLSFNVVLSRLAYGDLYASAAAHLERVSFDLTTFIDSGLYTEVDTSTFTRALERGEGQRSLVLFGWTPIVPHPDAYLRPLVHSSAPIPVNGGYSSPLADNLLDAAALLDDPAEQGARYRQVAEWLLAGFDIAPLWQDHIQVVAWDDIGGIQVEPNFLLRYDRLRRK